MSCGPDQVVPTDNAFTWHANGATKLALTDSYPGNLAPESVVSAVDRVCKEAPDKIAYKVKKNGEWIGTTYAEYRSQLNCVARAFLKLGLEKYHAVAISAFNCPECYLSSVGAIYAGSIVIHIFLGFIFKTLNMVAIFFRQQDYI